MILYSKMSIVSISERIMMKKLLILGLSASFLLAGCTSIQRILRGDEYVDSSLAASSKAAESSRLEKEKKDAITNKDAYFPQLSTKVAKDEAQVKLETTAGDITIKLFPKYAPLAVENFLTHAKQGYYDGVIFHRVIKDFMIQSGDPKGNGTGGESIWNGKDKTIDSGNGFKNEASGYLYNIRGALAMANAGTDTNGSQFYINQNQTDSSSQLSKDKYPAKIIEAYKKGGNPSLDGEYTVFGQVTNGMDIVDKIASSEVDESNKPKSDIKIKKIKIIKDYKFNK